MSIADALRRHSDAQGRVIPPLVDDGDRSRYATPEEFAAVIEPDSLNAAWAEAEAALRERGPLWRISALRGSHVEWWVEIMFAVTLPDGSVDQMYWEGPRETSPAAALWSVARKLREARG